MRLSGASYPAIHLEGAPVSAVRRLEHSRYVTDETRVGCRSRVILASPIAMVTIAQLLSSPCGQDRGGLPCAQPLQSQQGQALSSGEFE
jgi:hypothetical protein